jgi:hypothetical protein
MPLVNLDLRITPNRQTPAVKVFLREASRRIEEFQRSSPVPGFVPSDYERVYDVLHAVAEADVAPGRLFCEWGSGFGVVACFAASLDFDSCGIEIDPDLVAAARELARDFDLPVELVCGSFLPRGAAIPSDLGGEFNWLTTEGHCGHEELGLSPDDFAVIFAYPWPDEETVITDIFEQVAAPGAILVTYHGGDEILVRQKRSKGVRRR